MDCPVCKNTPMLVLELEQVEIDYCPDCGGIWLDSGELELFFESQQQACELIKSFSSAQTDEQKIKCPICLKKMEKISADISEKNIIIDRCKKAHGLWFDKGELADILKAGKFGKESRVIEFLKNMFTEENSERD